MRAWLLKWTQRVGVALGAIVGVTYIVGFLVLAAAWVAGEDFDRLRDWWEQPEARAMEAGLRRAFEAKDNERRGRPFALADIVEHQPRLACVIRHARWPTDKNDPAVVLAKRAGRIWFWSARKTDASLALEGVDGRVHLLRIWPPIELRLATGGNLAVCAPPDRLTFLPLASDNRAVVFLVRGD